VVFVSIVYSYGFNPLLTFFLQARATFQDRMAVLRDTCAGLAAMHSENYLHRDVKVSPLPPSVSFSWLLLVMVASFLTTHEFLPSRRTMSCYT